MTLFQFRKTKSDFVLQLGIKNYNNCDIANSKDIILTPMLSFRAQQAIKVMIMIKWTVIAKAETIYRVLNSLMAENVNNSVNTLIMWSLDRKFKLSRHFGWKNVEKFAVL